MAAPTANASANSRHGGQDREARGAATAAAKAAKTGVDWQDCPADWGLEKPIQCGYVTVPLDYAKPYGKQIKLAVDRIGNTGTKKERQGALIYNPGGPGGSGLRFPRRVTTKAPVWANTAKAYDFVGFDPRGVGHSAPISCVDPQEFVKAPKLDPVPDSEADKRTQRKLAREYAEGCYERSGEMLPHMTTPNTARDLDVIRAALGEKKLNYLGVSYGTYLGAVYGTLFPGHVRRMVVDSVVNPSRDKIWYEANLDQDVAFEGRWKDWEDWVAANDATFHLGDTRAEVQAKWLRVAGHREEGPDRRGRRTGRTARLLPGRPVLRLLVGAGRHGLQQVRRRRHPGARRRGRPGPVGHRGQHRLGERQRRLHGRRVHRRQVAHQLEEVGPGQHPPAPGPPLLLTWSNAWMNLPCATWPVKQQTPVNVKTGKGLPAC
ncbi:hypothetical protein SALBM311S_08912 [Streptomyces alboniger]